jgi:hypothetical protein
LKKCQDDDQQNGLTKALKSRKMGVVQLPFMGNERLAGQPEDSGGDTMPSLREWLSAVLDFLQGRSLARAYVPIPIRVNERRR